MSYVCHPDQPDITDIKLVDGVFMKRMFYRHAEMVVGQHAHEYDHISYIATGAVRVFADDRLMGEFAGGSAIVIKAQVKHRFMTLQPETTILCIHNADRADGHDDDVVIHEEHHLEGV